MVCAGLETITDNTITGFMKYPLSCDYYFYFKIMVGIFTVLTLILYFEERKRVGKSNILSCLAIAAIAVIFLSTIASLIGIITADIMILILVFGCIFIVSWLLT